MGSLFWFLALPSNQLSPRPLPDPAAPTSPPSAPILPPAPSSPCRSPRRAPRERSGRGNGRAAGGQPTAASRRPAGTTPPDRRPSRRYAIGISEPLRVFLCGTALLATTFVDSAQNLVDVPFDNPRHTLWACEISDLAPHGLMARPKSFVRVGMMTVSSSVQ